MIITLFRPKSPLETCIHITQLHHFTTHSKVTNLCYMTEEKQTRFNEIAQKHGDPWIWGIYLALIVISIVESYSASSREVASSANIYAPVIKQCAFLGIGALMVFFLHRIDYNKSEFLVVMIPGLALATITLLIYVLVVGEVINGAHRVVKLFPDLPCNHRSWPSCQ